MQMIRFHTTRAYFRKKGHACGITQKGQKGPVKGHNCGFLPLIFPKLGHLYRYTPLNSMFLEFLVKNKEFYSTKRALRADIARNKWLK